MTIYLILLALVGFGARKLSVFAVEGYGISAGLILLAVILLFAKYLSVHHDL